MRELSLEQKVIETIKKHKQIETGDKVIVAVSGGPDSICLLNILKNLEQQLKIEIFVAHINHGLRENAKQDEQYVKEYCEKNKIEYFVKHANVKEFSKLKKIGTEEAGRIIRYEFFEEVRNKIKGNKIAVAHNLNDNAETILMNILRGTGTEGLKGIEPTRENLIRPLIETTREEIENYCKKHNLNPRQDETNLENIYTRNKIRNQLIPYLQKEFNPNILEGLNRLSLIAKEESKYLKEIAEQEYNNIIIEQAKEKTTLDLTKFNKLENVLKKRILLHSIHILNGTTKGVEMVHIEDMLKLCENNRGNKYLNPNKNLKILVQNKKIIIEIIKTV